MTIAHRSSVLVALLAVALVAACTVAACGGLSATGGPTGSPAGGSPGGGGMVDGQGEWRLVRGSADGVAIPMVAGSDITLTVQGSQVGGRSACNQYGGEVVAEGGDLRFGSMRSTEMACPEPIMASEAAYLAALGRIRSATRDGDALTLAGPGVQLVYTRVEPPPSAALTGTDWVLDTLITGDAASSATGAPAILRLEADGSVRGSTGCRSFSGRWSGTPPTIGLADLVTGAAVPCPSTAAAQDAQVIAVLEHAASMTIDGRRLTITDGTQGLGYAAPTAVESGPA